ncbi:Uncharacterised protein [Mycobacteroides abscessus subsp. massiliense]|uniref:Gp6 protein n=1 Tax=Mycobacteroides abscessus subsp. bolletii 50594 TaxID=1303024 RepID=A0AB33A5P2_9MYCO|nr:MULTISPECIES: hypothetical protein [Mycobacteroides]AGM27014.1 hypothetical protein MASS_0412 [Mycobacteroides abscessus subsp. bolletii 50594]MBV0918016.1 hypothetical protein [Mycobacteroides chelonae]RIT59404.1 hypothetical protein D2E95_09450 [Mycobacteroides abscessus]RIU52486.1 hypothetical protein D2F02_05580 [Mycobacteroides abscessus]SHX53336.1 Uncharacterised protein [Mycobacteroides abscessus subsp. abscessus]
MTRSVIALDVTVTAVSIARIAEGEPVPSTGLIVAPPSGRDYSLSATRARTDTTAELVLDAVLSKGLPSLVVMSKLTLGDMNRDPSGGRRAALWWSIVTRLLDAGIPVAELATATAMKWLCGHGAVGHRGYDALDRAVRDTWPSVRERGETYRMSTVALAAAGCAVAGIPTAVPCTDARMKALSPMVLPSGWRLPETTKSEVA